MWRVLGRRKTHRDIWLAKLKERIHFEDLGIDVRRLLKRILKMGQEGAEWIHDKNRFQGVENTVSLTLGLL
jgi:hypothetical protein